MNISSEAGKPADQGVLVDVAKLITAYFTDVPDHAVPAQRVAFGTSGHRGTAFRRSFNDAHVVAITQAIVHHRKHTGIDGPLFLGIDTHALSIPASASALEVLAANGVEVMIAQGDEYTPTPVVSYAIIAYNRGRKTGLADGIVITPSHNPPEDGGFKYNAPHGGPADAGITSWIEREANALLAGDLVGVQRMPFSRALIAPTTHRHDYVTPYVSDLADVIDMEVLEGAKIRMGVDPLGGAGVHYWGRIGDLYNLDLTVVSEVVDPTFRFMTRDWDGQIRMDPSSTFAMQRLIAMKDRFDLSFACDTDHDRHGIVTKEVGLIPSNHYLCAAISYLFQNRPKWKRVPGIGKTMVSSQMIDRIAGKLGSKLFETPVGFKWFVPGLLDGSLGFAGEESAGATFARLGGQVWTTDKDGFILALLAGEMTVRMGRDPAEIYSGITYDLGDPFYGRVETAANPAAREMLSKISPQQFAGAGLAGEKILNVLTKAPGNDSPLGGVKLVLESGWFAARPSGTEDVYKIYAETFRSESQLQRILEEAQKVVDAVLAPVPAP